MNGNHEKLNPAIWTNGSTTVYGFIDPKHTMVYLDNGKTESDIVLDIRELAEIVKAVVVRQLKGK